MTTNHYFENQFRNKEMRKLGFSSIDQSPNTSNFEWSNSISDLSKNEISFFVGSNINSSKNESKLINRNLSNKNKKNITLLNGSNYVNHKAKKSDYLSSISRSKKSTLKNKRKGITIKKSNDTLLIERRLRSYDKIEMTEKSDSKTHSADKKTKSAIENSIKNNINKIIGNSLPIVALQPCTYVSPLVGAKKVFETTGKRKSIVMFSCSENAAIDEILHPTNEYSKKKSEKLQILPRKKVAKNFYRRVLTKEAFKGNKLDKKQRIVPSLNHITKSSDESSILPNTSEDANSFDSNLMQSTTLSSNLSIEEIKTPKISKALNSNHNIGITYYENKENMYTNSENGATHCLIKIASNENISVNCTLVTDKLLNRNETFSNKLGNLEKSIPECSKSYYSFNSNEKNVEKNISKDTYFNDIINNEILQNESFKTKSFEENQYSIINDPSISDNSYQLSHDLKSNENETCNIFTSTNQVKNLDQIDIESQNKICTVECMTDLSPSPIKILRKPKFSILNLSGNSKKSYPHSSENKTINIPISYTDPKKCDKSNSSNRSELLFRTHSFSNDPDGKQITLNCSRFELDHNLSNIDNIENFNVVEELSFLSNSSHKVNEVSQLSDDTANKSNINLQQEIMKETSTNQNDSRLTIGNKSKNESQIRYNLRTRNNLSNENTICQVSLKCSPVKMNKLVDKECDEDQTEIIKSKHNVIKTQELSKIPILKKIICNKELPLRNYIIDLDKSSTNQSDKSNNLFSTDKNVIGIQNISDSSQTIIKTFDLSNLNENNYADDDGREESLSHNHKLCGKENSKNEISGLNYDICKNTDVEILKKYGKEHMDNEETACDSSVVSRFSENGNTLSSDNKVILQNKKNENIILNENSQNNKTGYNLRERLNKTAFQKLDTKQTKSLPNFKLVDYETSREDIQFTGNTELCLNKIVNYDMSTDISNIDRSSIKQIKKVTFSNDTKVDNSVDNISINSHESNEESNNLSIKSLDPPESLKINSKLTEKVPRFQNSTNDSPNKKQISNLELSKNYIDRVFCDISQLLNIKEIDKNKSVKEFLEILVPNYSSCESSVKTYSCQDNTTFTALKSPQIITTSLKNIFNQNLLTYDKENNNCNTIAISQPTELQCQRNNNKANPKYSEIGTQTIRRGKPSRMKPMNKVNRETQCELSLCKTDESICQTVNTEPSIVLKEITKEFNKLENHEIVSNEILPVSIETEIHQINSHKKIKKLNITTEMEFDTRSYLESTRLMNFPKEQGKPYVNISPIASQKSVKIRSNVSGLNANEGTVENSFDNDEESVEESDIDSETNCLVIKNEDSKSINLNNKISKYRKQCDIIEEENEEESSAVIDAPSKSIHHTLCIESPISTTKRKHSIKMKSIVQPEDDKEADLSYFPSPIKCDFKKVRFNSSVDSIEGFSTFIEKNYNNNKLLSFVSPNDPIITVEGISFRGDGKRTRARTVSNPYETIVYQHENICYRKIDPSPAKIKDRKARLKQHASKSKSKTGKLDISKYIDSPDGEHLIIRNIVTNVEEKIKVIFDINEYYNIGFCKTNSLIIRKNVFTKQLINNQSDSIIQMIPIKQKRSSIIALIDKYKISFRPNQKLIVPKNIPYVLYNPNNRVVNIIQTVSLPTSCNNC